MKSNFDSIPVDNDIQIHKTYKVQTHKLLPDILIEVSSYIVKH